MNPKYLSARPRLSDRIPLSSAPPPIEFKRKYKSLNDTLRHIRLQVLQSLNFANEYLPEFTTPYELFRWLKDNTTYKNDPKGVELLQRMDTLINGDYWGTPGMGDCDCFTITTLACCEILGWKSWIKLAGRDKRDAVHIWSGVNWNGENIAMDITQPTIDSERPYPYVQKLNFDSFK